RARMAAERADQSVGRIAPFAVADHDAPAIVDESTRQRRTDAPGPPGDENHGPAHPFPLRKRSSSRRSCLVGLPCAMARAGSTYRRRSAAVRSRRAIESAVSSYRAWATGAG